jgi:hypothetical protein
MADLICHPAIQEEITRKLGSEKAILVFEQFGHSTLSNEIQDDLYDLISDYIDNNAEVSEELTGFSSDDCFPICIRSFGPIHWVEAQEFDPIKYFKSSSEALNWAEFEYSEFLNADPEEEELKDEDE